MRWFKKRQNSETDKQPVKEKGRNKKLHTGKGNTWLGQKRKRCGSFAESHSLRTRWIVCLRCLKWTHGNCAQLEGLADNCASYCCLCPTWASANFKILEGLTFFLSGTSSRSWMKQIRHFIVVLSQLKLLFLAYV